jgi:hypothetical protein
LHFWRVAARVGLPERTRQYLHRKNILNFPLTRALQASQKLALLVIPLLLSIASVPRNRMEFEPRRLDRCLRGRPYLWLRPIEALDCHLPSSWPLSPFLS